MLHAECVLLTQLCSAPVVLKAKGIDLVDTEMEQPIHAQGVSILNDLLATGARCLWCEVEVYWND